MNNNAQPEKQEQSQLKQDKTHIVNNAAEMIGLMHYADLARKAEALVSKRAGKTSNLIPDTEDSQEVIHQLQVYQAELEIQNEELRTSQAALMASRDRFSHLYHNAPIGYLSIDNSGIISEVNQRFSTMLKMPLDELHNQSLITFIHASDRDIFLGRFRAFYALPENKVLEIRMVCKDSSIFYASLTGRKSHRKIQNNSIHIAPYKEDRLLLTINDISARRNAEANLRLADKIIQSSQESVVVTDKKGYIINVNPCFESITGYCKDEVIGKNPSILQSGRQDKHFYNIMWQKLTNDGLWQGVVWNRRKNGQEYAEKLTINAIYGEHNEVTHFVGVFTDITDQLELEAKLRQSQKMEAVGTLVGGIAHDFNNMLAGILGNVYLAKMHADEQSDIIEHLDSIEQLGDRAAEMIAQMLTFARKGVVQMQPLALNSCIESILSSVAKVTIPANINMHIDICLETLMINADQTQLQQVIINLLSNARDALVDNQQAEITITLARYVPDINFLLRHNISNAIPQHLEFACLTITDNGCGIEEEQQTQIFEPFYTTKAVGKGTGLGLSMVYGSLQTHNGVLQVDSKKGKGTQFQMFFPLLDSNKTTKITDLLSIQKPLLSDSQRETLLIVDDEETVRTVTSKILAKYGYKFILAKDGQEAFEIFQQRADEIDLVLLDVVMPKMNGGKVAKKIREINPTMPIIFMTGYDKENVISDEGQLDNCLVLTKPFKHATISRMLRKLLI
ncbi:MAG: PAS domain S-box protein [Mariprofundales bacterium]